MNQRLKRLIERPLRLLFAPLRQRYSRRNGALRNDGERKELPNDAFLGLASETLAQGHTVVIWVKGFSMRPFIEHERDRVKLQKKEVLTVGDAVLAQIAPGHYVLHRIIQLDGDHIVLQGDGNVRGVEHCLRSDVCGTVIEYIRPRRTILATDPVLVRRVRLWRKMRPVRRWLLALYKLLITPTG